MKFANYIGIKGESQQKSVGDSIVSYQSLREPEEHYKPQSSFFIKTILASSHLRNKISDAAMSKIEGLLALFGALSEVQSYTGFLSVLTLYVKTHNTESILGQVHSIVSKFFSDMKPQSSSRPKWLEDMSLALLDWKLLINSPSFAKISRVLSLLVTLGIMERKSINLGNFELFAVEAQVKHCNAVDLFDALCETVVYFAEGAYQCFTTGSIKPLLFSSNEVVQLEEQYIQKLEEWEFVRNGNLERFTDKTEAQFDNELDAVISRLSDLYKTMPSGAEKKIVQTKWEHLSKIRTEFISVRISGGLRKAPFCVKVYGNSGVGKSTFTDIVMVTVLKAMGLPCTSDYICTLNESDKYMSNYRSYITGIKIDDYGNTRSQFVEAAPTDWIIKICNNIREYAVMADIANKGKITIEPGCLTITTNQEDLHAATYSVNPMSILRRAHIHVELNVRPEFKTDNMLDSNKVVQQFGSLDKINDIWLITVKKPIANTTNSQLFNNWDIVKNNISIYEFLDYLVEKVKIHNAAQTCIVDSFKEPSDLVHFCPDCKKLQHSCKCNDEMSTVTPHFGERIAHVVKNEFRLSKQNFDLRRLDIETKVEDMALDQLFKLSKNFYSSPYCLWINWLPEDWFNHSMMQRIIIYYAKDCINADIKVYHKNMLLTYIVVVGLCHCIFHSYSFDALFAMCYGLYYFTVSSRLAATRQQAYLNELIIRRGALHKAFIDAREKHAQYACGMFAGLAVLYGVVKVAQAIKANINVQGMLSPKSVEDIRARDKETNPWQQDTLENTNGREFNGQEGVVNSIKKAVAQIDIGNQFSGALLLCTHVAMFPKHMLPEKTIKAVVTYRGNKCKFILNPERCVILPDKDAVLCYIPNTPPLKNITKFFVKSKLNRSTTCKMVGLKADRSFFTSKLNWTHVDSLHNGFMAVAGSHYSLELNTFAGMCMSPIFVDNEQCAIVGVHIGGVTNTSRGCGMSLTQFDIESGVAILYSKSNTHMPGPQACEVEDEIMGRKIAISSQVHRKCPTNFITGDCDIEVYGSVNGRATHITNVVETPMSAVVEEVCGVPNQWAGPKFSHPEKLANGKIDAGHWKPWFASLEVCSKPSIGFDPVDVEQAMDDYLVDLLAVFHKQSELWKQDIRPLTDIEIVSGIDGKRFIDAMPSGTSMGYPIQGPKNKHLIDLEPTEEHSCPRTFTKEIWDEVDKLYAKADNSECLNQIFSASLKDEPTKKNKDKVRVFQAAPVTLQIVIRKYFLPIARFLSTNPLISECAVGINAHGSEWHELSQFMAKFGDDRIIAGDYSKYDLRMPAQLTLSAFGVLIRIAMESGNYTKQDIRRMFVIAHDVCTPLTAYNGTLMRFLGTNPSGQNLTVYVNSIVNSLLHRVSFFSVYPKEELTAIGKQLCLGRPARFRDLVAVATYGDDAKGSVRKGYDKFNHISMARYLKQNDMIFTMPDKESEPKAFMTRWEADFLKRQDRFDEDLGHYVGMLDENSIFKSLHSVIKSKSVPLDDVAIMNIQGALREWFFHGRGKFEMRRAQMKEIASRMCYVVPEIDCDYDYRVQQWKEKYVPQSGCHINKAEDVLKQEIKMKIGSPTLCDEPIMRPHMGRPDMVYMTPKFILCIETKIVAGKPSKMRLARKQANKYATCMHVLLPTATVVGAVYTEDGLSIVKIFGTLKIPKQYAAFLESANYDNLQINLEL